MKANFSRSYGTADAVRASGSRSRGGVALIITLIMLSVITVMAVAFLALSRRERSAVVHSSSAIDAEFMANSGAERAKAEILANIITYSNYVGPGFLVSGARTNQVRTPADIPYFYEDPRDGTNDAADRAMIAQLRQDAHPPVFVGRARDPRFYLDINRNGRYETNGLLDVLDASGSTIPTTNGVEQSLFIGDPEWFGVLSRPYEPHSRDNRFIGRYAFLILPAGTTLDLNYIHNQAKDLDMNAQLNGYFRNQGVGTWEINLAAFLADLNPNIWNRSGEDYYYDTNLLNSSRGSAFIDARELLAFRYNGDHRTLATAAAMLQPSILTNFPVNGIDDYTDGPLLSLGARPAPILLNDADNPSKFWPGADSKKHMFSMHDLFDDRKVPNYTNFIDRLRSVSNAASSFDRYTFSRLLSQLTTDSVPEKDDKININYKNIEGTNSTNFVSWQPLEFFTNVCHRMLREEFPLLRAEFGTNVELYTTIYTNLLLKRIPVLVNGKTEFTNANNIIQRIYCPRIHQLLQLSCNIFQATVDEKEQFFPTVFRPVFHYEKDTTNIYIVDFIDETGPGFYNRVLNYQRGQNTQMKWHTLDDSSDWFTQGVSAKGDFDTNDFFYGVPFIVGAKKGFPNFNELAVQTMTDCSRKLQFVKDAVSDTRPKQTNQMFIFGVSNAVAVEAWNSYDKPYPRDIRIVCGNVMGMTLTNDAPFSFTPLSVTNNGGMTGADIKYDAGTWGGLQFRVPLISRGLVLTDAVYRLTPQPHFDPISATNVFETAGASYTNKWGLTVTNKLLFFMFDDQYKYLIDAVSVANRSYLDISTTLSKPENSIGLDQFVLNPQGGVTEGVMNQIRISSNPDLVDDTVWRAYGVGDKAQAGAQFASFLTTAGTNLVMQAPFTPIFRMVQSTRWEANDPLVHAYPADLETLDEAGNPTPILFRPTRVPLAGSDLSITNSQYSTISRQNKRYRPWNINNRGLDPTATDLLVKDSRAESSESWDFPVQKFPNIGWLGRVHRGTPWQTIYLKGGVAQREEWLENQLQGGPGNSMETHPTNDWRLVDYFTVAMHPNASKGRLSVNQTNLAAWSAVLSGAMATKLYTPKPGEAQITDQLIQPAALEPPVLQIVEGINRARESMPDRRFERLSDLLSVPELTVASPFLKAPYSDEREDQAQFLRDIDYERIPDQIMSLLKLGEPRFVIYAFGQSLKPEYVDPSSGVAWNYQITGEVATRSVVRVEFEPKSTNVLSSDYLKPDVFKPHIVVEQYNILPPE